MIVPRADSFALVHELGPVLTHLASIRSRRALARDPIYRRWRSELARVLTGFEWDFRACAPRAEPGPWRAAAWNIERGKRFEALVGVVDAEPLLRGADFLLLTEVDIGMGRSGNRNIARALAERLGMGYVFANYHLVLAPGDSAEREHGVANTLALHGCALLSRYPIRSFAAVELPEFTDKFHALEKRLGSKRGLLCEVMLPDGPLLIAVVHLDPFAPPPHRARQMRAVVAAIEATRLPRVLLGGDLNTNTYHLGSKIGLARDIVRKLTRFGITGTVRQYMTPEEVFEREVFEVLRQGGLEWSGFTDPGVVTLAYDLNDPEVRDKSLAYLPTPVLRWLERRLAPWGGAVPMRVDHFAGRGLQPHRAVTLVQPQHQGVRVSDHSPLVVECTAGDRSPD